MSEKLRNNQVEMLHLFLCIATTPQAAAKTVGLELERALYRVSV